MWGKAFMAQDIEEVLLSEEQIKKRVQELGDQISKDYDGQEIIVLCVLKGASIFFSDLCRAITVHMKMDFMGNAMEMTILRKDGKTYMINAAEKQVQEMPAGGMGGADINFLNLTDQVKAANKIKEAGKETILGRECTKYTMESSQMGMTMSQTVWVWNGIVLKSLTDGGQFQFGNTATKLEENANIPASTFDIPKF